MPEIKNNFLKGKMNKDLDERLIPSGQYRDALNIEVATAEDSSVGTIKNILGNRKVEDIVPNGFKCVGSIADEKNNKLYWFVSSYKVDTPEERKDAIIEYDTEYDKVNPVIVDLNAGTFKAVLKFSGNIITGINIIDEFLYWTDNNSDPKKINIKECIKGTPDFDTHTQLIFEDGSFDGITATLVTPWSGKEIQHAPYFTPPHPKTGRYVWCEDKQLKALLGVDSLATSSNFNVRHYRNSKYLGTILIRVSTGDNATRFRFHNPALDPQDADELNIWQVGDVIFGDNINIDIEDRHITVIKPKPLNTFSVKINHTQNLDSINNIPNIFETKFPRFSYRYKYRNSQFSSFSPFTNAIFNPKYTKNTNESTDVNVFYNKDTAYDIKDPHNKAMVNSIHSIELTDFITAQTPEDVEEIEILYKQENSPVIYSIGSVKHTDSEWHAMSGHEGLGLKIGLGKSNLVAGAYNAQGGYTKGKYIVTTENIYAALPANQILRPWDNVPRKALAQEMTGNRIVYGNYLQNYNLSRISKPKVKISYNQRKNLIGSFEQGGLPSVKSQRNYQLGVIYCDKYGRETPVFTSDAGAVNIPWQENDGIKNASKSLQLNASVASNFPEWVDSLKFFIKETSNEYYNLTMERAWVTKSTYELDNSEGHLWISFPSSDRNKISEEDYIILKKKIGTGEEQVNFENKFKVIDVKNEAPDAIKYELVNYGAVPQNGAGESLTLNIFQDATRRIDSEVDVIHLNAIGWKNYQLTNLGVLGQVGLEKSDETDSALLKDLYISWRKLDASGLGVSSKKYKIIGGRKDSTKYIIKLSTKISKIDADIAHLNGSSEDGPEALLHPDLLFQIEKKELKGTENFSGKFFVKISKNQITDLIEGGEPTTLLDQYEISSKISSFYWEDYIGESQSINADGSPSSSYGLTNFAGYPQSPSGVNRIRDGKNNVVGNNNKEQNGTLRMTDYSEAWEGILSKFGPTFFVDSMHMASGQSNASNYAKYNCILWSGCTQDDGGDTNEDSAWSYPPLKKWLTDFQKKTEFLSDPALTIEEIDDDVAGTETSWSNIPIDATWFEGNLISISPQAPNSSDWNALPVDGWVGNLQNVTRHHPFGIPYSPHHVNGLEGFVTTDASHASGPRRWFSGITGNSTEHGVGVDTKTYSDNGEEGRHFMHISFFAPGKNLHDGYFDGSNNMTRGLVQGKTLYGPRSYAANLQGIWGGGHFTAANPADKFGDGTDKHWHLCMEGNHGTNNEFLKEPPGPGVGYGYDVKYRELHERQWDPTFNEDNDDDNKIRDFIRNLHAGSQFKFNRDTSSEEVYTIKKVVIKKLYNHTSWRKPYNRYIIGTGTVGVDYGYIHSTGQHPAYRSVEQVGLEWLDELDDDAMGGTGDYLSNFNTAITNFGKAHNRRVCYIVELDKNPTASTSPYNPIADENEMSADSNDGIPSGGDFTDIEFLEPVESVLLSDLSKFPAIWELDPKKKQVDLDIYYEVSNNIPVKINNNTNELIAPIGCIVEILDSPVTSTSRLLEWDGTIATFDPGFARGDGVNEVDYTGVSFKFIREDGSFIIAEAGGQQLIGSLVGNKTLFGFREDIGDSIRAGLSWYNCFSFGNGIESNRIRDDFNEMFITNGVKASTTTQRTYEEERRSHGLIYSGLYNSNSGVNDLNQFIMAEKITKDLSPAYGSIQKLFQRRISLIAFCEDRVLSITSNKDALYNADGNMQLVATENVLGDVNPFVGNFGISKNPESFASESYRAYFTDKARGTVLRLSKDGITPISKTGMHDWFRDNLPKHRALIGTYDSYKENYNITLSNTFDENILSDTYLETGVQSLEVSGGVLNVIENPGPYSGDNFKFPWEENDVLTHANFTWGSVNANLESTATITNHSAIPKGSIQNETPAGTAQPSVMVDAGSGPLDSPAGSTTAPPIPLNVWTENGVPGQVTPMVPGFQPGYAGLPYIPAVPGTTIPFAPAIYDTNLPNSGGTFDGQFYAPVFNNSPVGPAFGGNAVHDRDPAVYSTIRRHLDIGNTNGSGSPVWVQEGNPTNIPNTGGPTTLNAYGNTFPNGAVNGQSVYPVPEFDSPEDSITGVITQDGSDKSILFDRVPNPESAWVEFRDIGKNTNNNSLDGELNNMYNFAPGTMGNALHSAFFNGDELHVTFELAVYGSFGATSFGMMGFPSWNVYGYNHISPKLELFDGEDLISSDVFVQGLNVSSDSAASHTNPKDYQHIFSDLTSVFGAGYANTSANGNNYNTWSGGPTDYRSFGGVANNQHWPGSSTVQWNNTSSISNLMAFPWFGGNAAPKTITFGASFKFRDPAQQGSAGGTNQNSYIQEEKVINDLRIRISQTDNFGHPEYGMQTGLPDIMKNPLWHINSVKAVKGYGVRFPSEASHVVGYVAAIPATPAGPPVSGPAVPANYTVPGMVPGLVPNTLDGVTTYHFVGDPGYPFVAPTYTTATLGIHYVAPVPHEDVPAWTEVKHDNPNWFEDWVIEWGSGNGHLKAHTEAGFGSNYPSTTLTGYRQNTAVQLPPQDPTFAVSYEVPNDWQHLLNPGSGPFNSTPYHHTDNNPNGDEYEGIGLDNPSVETYNNNNYLNIESQQGEAVTLTQDISDSPWVAGQWYLIDIEYSYAYNPDTGTGSGNGWVDINGVLGNGGFASNGAGSIVHPDGVGTYSPESDSNNVHLRLLPVVRKEYGTKRTVLRGIFRFGYDSYRNLGSALRGQMKIKFWNCLNKIRITKIITKKLNTITTTGGADGWIKKTGGQPTLPKHAFDKTELYWKNNKLCWEVRQDQLAMRGYRWEQDLGGQTPKVVPLGWTLNFKISKNPNTNNFVGNLRGWIGRPEPNNNHGHEGVYFRGITHAGEYEIKFNMNGDTGRVNLEGAAIPWSIKRKNTSGNWYNYSGATLTTTYSGWNPSIVANKISFQNTDGITTDMAMGVGNIFLTDETVIFQGGSAASWNFDGFNTSVDNYIHWDITSSNLVFFDCPAIDPNATTSPSKLININQWINNNTTPISRYQKYKIEFSYLISTGKISIYYFNSEGYGFKVDDISSSTATTFDKVVMVGDGEIINDVYEGDGYDAMKWKSVNPLDPTYAADLKETFVIGLYDDSELVNGWIDDIRMTRVYDVNEQEPKTVTFSEDVNGWTSFKSFIPENGLSLSKKYFTIKDGSLYQHYVPMQQKSAGDPWSWKHYDGNPLQGGVAVEWTLEQANNYNTFYGNSYSSNVTAVLNSDPSTVKVFNTLNYEGSQAHVIKPDHISKVTVNNAQAWGSESHIDGWNCVEIKTDLDAGSVVEFIKKEGKWFNYIKGKAVNLNLTPDTSRFSVQGVGIVSSITSVTI